MKKTPVRTLVLLVALAGCGGDNPSPSAPAATVSPTPTPRPSPSPVTLGQGIGCGLARMPECGQTSGPPQGDPPGVYGCCQKRNGGGTFAPMIQEAIDRLKNEQPAIFGGDGNGVRDRVAYINGVALILERDFKVCSVPGAPGDEVGIKTSNDSSEQYDIYTADAKTRYPGYQVTCIPARF